MLIMENIIGHVIEMLVAAMWFMAVDLSLPLFKTKTAGSGA
jgi:hypothetical protein